MTASFLKDRFRLWLRPGSPRLSSLWQALPLLLALAITLPALGQATIHVPADQPTIQGGIAAAANGDTVLVSPGTYHEHIDFQGKAITLTSVSGPAVTIIDGGASGPVVAFHSGELRSSVISGFTIRNGGAEPQPSVAGAGGVYINAAAPTISNNIITANACHGVWVSGGAALIEGNEINQTTGANDYCTFSGSAILLISSASLGTGAQQVSNNVVLTNTIEQNVTANYYDGGGIFLWKVENSVIESNIIRNNATTGQGGGIVAYNSDAMLIAQNLITGNSAGYGAGGISLTIPDSSQGPFRGFIQDNTFSGNTISNPSPSGVPGSQVYIDGNLAQYEFTNNIVIGNSSWPAFMCGTTYDYLSLTPLVIDHNDIYNPSGPGYGGNCPDQTNTYGNIAADPLFNNAANGDYHLQASSAAIDTGNNSALQLIANDGFPLATDPDGKPRLQDATGKGYPIIDMGAYEYAGSQDAQATTVLLTPSAWSLDGGTNLILTAQLASAAGIPTGAVTFYEDGNQVGTGSIDGSGAASFTLTKIVPGPHAFVATYSGDGSFPPAVSVKIYVLVDKDSVTLTLASTPNPSLVNQTVTFTITSNSPDSTHPGPITLTDNGDPLTTLTPDPTTGSVTFATSALTVGSHVIVAAYAGDATHLPARQSLTQQVLSAYPTNTALNSSLNPALVKESVTFTATVTPGDPAYGTPTGSVAFSDNGATVTTVPLVSGIATWTTSTLTIGNHIITATYVPTTDYAVSSASITQVINGLPDTSQLGAAPNPALALAPVTLTAIVTAAGGSPTGSVNFLDGAQVIGTAPLNPAGVAVFQATFATSGVHTLTATYNGDATFATSTSAPFPETIQANASSSALNVAPSPSGVFQPVTFIAGVSSPTAANPNGGTVTFSVGGNPIGTATLQNGAATFTTSAIDAGTWSATATYNGTGAYSPSTSGPISFVVVPESTTTTLKATPNPAMVGTNVALSATVAAPLGTVTGTVTFMDGANLLATVPVGAGGVATLNTSSLTLGMHNISATYSGGTDFLTGAPAMVQVDIIGFLGDFSISATPASASVYTGEAATFTVTVTPNSGFDQTLALDALGSPSTAITKMSASSLANGTGTFTVTVQTAAPQTTASGIVPTSWPKSPWSLPLATGSLASLLLLTLPARFRRRNRWLALLAFCAVLIIPGCGAPAPVTGGTAPGTYNIQLSATASNNSLTLSHSVTVQLTVKSLFQ